MKAEAFISDETRIGIADINVALEKAGINATIDLSIDAKPSEERPKYSRLLAGIFSGLAGLGFGAEAVIGQRENRRKDEDGIVM